MRILILSYYYEPDLGAGAFRNTALVNALRENYQEINVDVCTTAPTRYDSYKKTFNECEKRGNLQIMRFKTSISSSNFIYQITSFLIFFWKVKKFVKNKKYDLVYASSSRLMTAFLGALISNSKKCHLYLDFRDIFRDVLKEMNMFLFILSYPILFFIERYTLRKAKKINLISKGFHNYFSNILPNSNFSFFTNGIDKDFLHNEIRIKKENPKIRILYAGNVGFGQSLEMILPEIAKKLSASHEFLIIGDGGKKRYFQSLLKKEKIDNIILKDPIERKDLIKEYLKADILFLHLNNIKAFEKVLPSKIFEYAAMNKPILAGVSGYSEYFMKKEITNCSFFSPGNSQEALKRIFEINLDEKVDRTYFINKFSRDTIMKNFSRDLVLTLDK